MGYRAQARKYLCSLSLCFGLRPHQRIVIGNNGTTPHFLIVANVENILAKVFSAKMFPQMRHAAQYGTFHLLLLSILLFREISTRASHFTSQECLGLEKTVFPDYYDPANPACIAFKNLQ